MEKIYILDTNVLIQAPYAVECFEENEVVLPMTVLEELDNLKKEEGEKGANGPQGDPYSGCIQRKGKSAGGSVYGAWRYPAGGKKLSERRTARGSPRS